MKRRKHVQNIQPGDVIFGLFFEHMMDGLVLSTKFTGISSMGKKIWKIVYLSPEGKISTEYTVHDYLKTVTKQ